MYKKFRGSNSNYNMAFLNTGTQALEQVLKVVDAGMAGALLVAAAKAKIFDDFRDGIQTSEAIAAKRQWEPARAERLLNGLASMKMLTRTETGSKVEFGLTPSGHYLISDSPETIHEYVTNFTSMFSGEMGKVVNKYVGKDYVPDPNQTYPSGEEDQSQGHGQSHDHGHGEGFEYNEEKMYRCMQNLMIPGLDKLLTSVDLSKYKTCIDLGGGTGAVAVALTRLNPQISVTVIEMESVIKVAKQYFLTGKENRVSFKEGDFFKEDIPTADLYVLSKVMHHWTSDQTDTMMKKLFNAINPGGGLLFFEWCLYDSKNGPNTMAHTWDLMCQGDGGGCYSGKEFKELMEKYGFRDFQLHRTSDHFHYDVVFAKKP